MTRFELELPDELALAARARAAESGFACVEAYASALMQAELADPDTELERLLVARLSDTRPKIEATPEFWNDLSARVRSQIGSAKVTR